jgi:creatinine amidohydrolase
MEKAKWWWNMKRPEIEGEVKKCDIVLLPIGSIEQHGPHMPTGADYFNSNGIAERVSERSGVIIAPPIPYGSHPYFHYGYMGTLPIRALTQIQLLRDVVKGLVNNGFTKIILINAHGQWWTLHTAIQEIALDVNAFMAVATWQEIARATIEDVLETPSRHADESEASLALYLFPDKIDMTKAVKEALISHIDAKAFIKSATHGVTGGCFCIEAMTAFPQQSESSKHGVIGDPTLATREKGEKIVDAAVRIICALIEELKSRFKVGEVPGVRPQLKVDYY